MIKWYDRIGNRIEMKLYENADKPYFQWVKGNVIEGYRYRDGIVTMESDDGRIIWCGIESGDFRKSEDSLGDFISNADRIYSMNDEELAQFLCKVKADYQWVDHEFPSEEECGEWEEWLKSESE